MTAWNTVVGRGARGAAAGDRLVRGPRLGRLDRRGTGAAVLFGVLFLWQLPHFLAIAWMYRDDYAAGGLKMLPGCDPPAGAPRWRWC